MDILDGNIKKYLCNFPSCNSTDRDIFITKQQLKPLWVKLNNCCRGPKQLWHIARQLDLWQGSGSNKTVGLVLCGYKCSIAKSRKIPLCWGRAASSPTEDFQIQNFILRHATVQPHPCTHTAWNTGFGDVTFLCEMPHPLVQVFYWLVMDTPSTLLGGKIFSIKVLTISPNNLPKRFDF